MTSTRLSAISDQIKQNQTAIENLRLDMAEAIHQEFMYLFNKIMMLTQQQQNSRGASDNLAEIDFGNLT